MTIDISGVSVSIPNGISDWVHENEDNKTEFEGMLQSIMYAVKTFYKNKYNPNPYQEIYEQQVKEFMDLGCGSREDADRYITELIKFSDKRTNEQWDKDGTNALINLIKTMNNR
jgi:hypothetical protein